MLNVEVCQMNATVGDLVGNRDKIIAAIRVTQADVIVFPECALTGYPLEDLVLREQFLADVAVAARDIRDVVVGLQGPTAIFGLPWASSELPYNAAMVATPTGSHLVYKHELPNYGEFDEKRTFSPGPLEQEPITIKGHKVGVVICEDLWLPNRSAYLKSKGAELLISINGSPFMSGKQERRFKIAKARSRETELPIIYVNLVGGQDELVFDGGSFVWHHSSDNGADFALPFFREAKATFGVLIPDSDAISASGGYDNDDVGDDRIEMLYRACVLGLRDYVGKNGFPGVVIGSSGGIDSALTAAIAVDALGEDRVLTIALPSDITSDDSNRLADQLAAMIGVELKTIPIGGVNAALCEALAPTLDAPMKSLVAQNLQARIRGQLLMAVSNQTSLMVVSTGNKSEMSVGYATLYGDMCGGFNVLKDIYKTDVFAMAKWRNSAHGFRADFHSSAVPAIPSEIIARPPTAELMPGQKDDDDLPPYEILDPILRGLVEEEWSIRETAKNTGHPIEVVVRVRHLLDRAQYKRYQAPPGLKLTARNFGRGRRYPITNHYREV